MLSSFHAINGLARRGVFVGAKSLAFRGSLWHTAPLLQQGGGATGAQAVRSMALMPQQHTEGEYTKVVPSIEDAIKDIHDGATM